LPDDDDVDDASLDDAAGGVRAFWSGTISFGLVSIPVNLFAATRGGARIHLRMLAPDGVPLRREYFCPKDGEALSAEDLARGYELDTGEVVVVTDEELEALAPEKSRDIDLRRFVPLDDLDPLFFERSYILGPAGESTKAYRLLAETMESTRRAGIATFVMRGKEYLVAIVAENGILRAETLRFANEVRTPEDIELPDPPERVDAKLVRRFERAIASLAGDALPLDELQDAHAEKVRALVEEKRANDEGVVTVDEDAAGDEGGDVVDIMQLIQKSLTGGEPATATKKKATKKKATKKTAAKKKATKKKATKKKARAPTRRRRARTKRELMDQARRLGVEGRSEMTKVELEQAVAE
jgi:DNA end-binding protein Ku